MPRRLSIITRIENDHPSFDDYLNMAFEANPDLPRNELPPFVVFQPLIHASCFHTIEELRRAGWLAIRRARFALGLMPTYGPGGTYVVVSDEWAQAIAQCYMPLIRAQMEQDIEDAIDRAIIRFENDWSTMEAMLPEDEEDVMTDLSESLGSQDTESDME